MNDRSNLDWLAILGAIGLGTSAVMFLVALVSGSVQQKNAAAIMAGFLGTNGVVATVISIKFMGD